VSPKIIKPKLKSEIRSNLGYFNEFYDPMSFSIEGDYFVIRHPDTGMYRGKSGDYEAQVRYLGYESPIHASRRGHEAHMTEWDFPEDIRNRMRPERQRRRQVMD